MKRRDYPYAQKPASIRQGNKAWKPEAILDAVREECFKAAQAGKSWVTAEALMTTLRAKKSSVTAALQKLVHEGIVGHKQRGYRHDREFSPSTYTLLIGNRKGEPLL